MPSTRRQAPSPAAELTQDTQSEMTLDATPQEGENDHLESAPLIQPLESPRQMPQQKQLIIALLVAVLLGSGTGLGLYQLQAKGGVGGPAIPQDLKQVAGDSVAVGDVFGSPDTSTFKDSAEGYLQAGGLEGEGSHQLLRAGGDSQTVYLTSSVTDLDSFVGMDIKVWGETFKGQKAGWLMDVGRVEVLSLEGEAPSEK